MENTFACWNILFILIYRHQKKTCVTINRSKLKTNVLTIYFFSGLRPSGYWTIFTENCSKHRRHKIFLFKCCEVYCLWSDINIFSKIILFFSNLNCLFRHCYQHIFNSIWINSKPHTNEWSTRQQRDVKVIFKTKDRQLLRYEIFRASS